MPGRSRRERLEDLLAGGRARLERARSRSLVERGALDTAVAARLLEDRPGFQGRYRFHHPIVRDLLHRWQPAGERARRPPLRRGPPCSWPTSAAWSPSTAGG
jgi:hypothetical protein